MYLVRAFAVAVRSTANPRSRYTLRGYIHYVDRHIRFVSPSRPQYTLRRESQQRLNAVGLAKALLHRAIVTLQLFELTSRGFAVFTAFATLAAPSIKDPSAPNIGRNDNAGPPRFAVGSPLFRRLFSHRFFLRFHANLDLSFHRCPDSSCGGSLTQSRISRSDAS